MKPREKQAKWWAPPGVLQRVERARGMYLARTGVDVTWAELGRLLGWSTSTTSAVKTQSRPLRVEEVGDIAQILDCSPGWLAFGEGELMPYGLHPLPPTPSRDVEPESRVRPSRHATPKEFPRQA